MFKGSRLKGLGPNGWRVRHVPRWEFFSNMQITDGFDQTLLEVTVISCVLIVKVNTKALITCLM